MKWADFLVAVFCTGVFDVERGFCKLRLLAEVLCQGFGAVEDASGVGARGVIVSLFLRDSLSIARMFRHSIVDFGSSIHWRSGTNAIFTQNRLLFIRHIRVQFVQRLLRRPAKKLLIETRDIYHLLTDSSSLMKDLQRVPFETNLGLQLENRVAEIQRVWPPLVHG